MKNKEGLESCPFCHSISPTVKIDNDRDQSPDYCYVECQRCFAKTSIFPNWPENNWIEEAKLAWNHRG